MGCTEVKDRAYASEIPDVIEARASKCYYTFSLAVENDADNAQMNRVYGKDHDQRCLSNLTL